MCIFVKSVERAKFLNQLLRESVFPSICIHSKMEQSERLEMYREFKEGKARIMVSTDLIARGIDVERVNIVINYDMPENADTYLHRVGRAGLRLVFLNDSYKLRVRVRVRVRVCVGAVSEDMLGTLQLNLEFVVRMT